MSPTHGLRLRKWYVDCVAADGAVFVGYLALLRWGRLRLDYTAALELAPGGRLAQRQSLRGGTIEAGDGVRMEVPSLGVTGTWIGGTGTGPQRIVATDAGTVTWQALSLAASADVAVRDRTYRGAGYAEVVTLTVPPWRLPFSELCWGRFVADDASVGTTWIETSGGRDPARVWTFATPGLAPDAHPALAPGGVTLRSGLVGDTLLGKAKALAWLLPRGVRFLSEDKRLSRGTLATAAGDATGWVIHEEVSWR